MLDHETLQVIWWLILGVLLIGFAITDGFDLGVGAIFRFAGRTDEERRALLATVEPVWEGNQVWFILGGGAVFAAWPVLYATSFSSLYLAMFAVLVALILRPVGFTYRDKLTDRRWRNAWDWALFLGGALPALLLGVAVGNLFLGVPFHFDELRRPIYTGTFIGLLHPYALLAGVVSLSMLVMHGCAYAALKVGAPMSERAAAIGRIAATVFVLTFITAGIWVAASLNGHRLIGHVELVRGGWIDNFRAHPILWVVPALALLSARFTFYFLGKGRSGAAFLSSCVTQAGTILTAGVALFPFVMPSSSVPNDGLTVWNASSSELTLRTMLIVVIIFLPIVLIYTAWVYRVLKGRITLEEIRRHGGLY